MKSDYYQRREARIDGLRAAAERAEKKSEQHFTASRELADMIPMGQPILVGHHSEGRHRRHLAKIDSHMSRGIDEAKRAQHYAQRAYGAASNRAISSDAPDATERLREKIAATERNQEFMKQANILIRKNDRAGLAAMGLTEKQIEGLFSPDFCGRIGFPDYSLKNNNANIRRMKERLAQLEKAAIAETREEKIGKAEIVDNAEENRTQIFFPGKPPEAFRAQLKSWGFHWCKSEGCWQRFRSPMALQLAREAAKQYAQL